VSHVAVVAGSGVESSRGVEFQPAVEAATEHVGQCDEESSGRVQGGRVPSWARGCSGGCCAGESSERAAASAGAGLAAPKAHGFETAPEYRPLHGNSSGDEVKPADEASVWEAELREVNYSWAGDFDQMLGGRAVEAALSPIGAVDRLSGDWRCEDLRHHKWMGRVIRWKSP
jgi:hypothetical protein